MLYRILDTPTGDFALRASASGQLATGWLEGSDDPFIADADRSDDLRPDVAEALNRYFAGEAVDFGFLPVPEGPPFFQRCWEACRSISRGRTSTYGELARAAGSGPGAARAAGQAMRRNPLPIVVPCHRVVGTGDLGGFSGTRQRGDRPLRVKEWLLRMEGPLFTVDNDDRGRPQPGHQPEPPAEHRMTTERTPINEPAHTTGRECLTKGNTL